MKKFIELLNNNQGVIATLGLFFVIPLSIFSDRILTYIKDRNRRKQLKKILLKELSCNMNYVSQIEESYKNQMADLDNLHLPHYPPRTNVIKGFFEFGMLDSLEELEKRNTIEIFEQLSDLKQEYFLWRNKLIEMDDLEIQYYKAFSSTLLSYISPVMRNMIELWAILVKDIGEDYFKPQIQEINQIITEKAEEGKWIRTSYKASFFNKDQYKNMDKFDVILCWENDWQDANKEVIEIKDMVSLNNENVNSQGKQYFR